MQGNREAELEQRDRCVVVLNTLGGVQDPSLSRWLAKASMSRSDAPANLVDRILEQLGRPVPVASPAAYRYAGQRNQLPRTWLAAADPVYLEPRLDHLCLHSQSGQVDDSEMSELVEHLNSVLGGTPRFFSEAGVAYIEDGPRASAILEPDELHGFVPNDFLPRGDAADELLRVLSEVEMALHEHPVNLSRQERGLQPVNSLWIWGGGELDEPDRYRLPTLVADDPLLRGVWGRTESDYREWGGALAAELRSAGVIVVPEDSAREAEEQLTVLRREFDRFQSRDLVILTRDGVSAVLRPFDRFRIWRRQFSVPGIAA